MRHAPALALLLVVLAAAPACAAAPAAPADARAFVARVIEAHGGWARLERVHAYRVEGTLFAIMRHTEAPTVRVSAGAGRIKILIDYEDGHEARLLDHARGWRATGGGDFEAVSGPMLDATTLQAARADVPWILHERVAAARLTEPFVEDSLRLPGVEIPLEGGLVLRVFVDPATWRVRVSQGLLTHGGMQTHFETVYGDWRDVEGVWFPFHEENWASGAHTGDTTLQRVLLNPKLAPDEFVPPHAKGAARPEDGSSS